jgi:hypothetical protein
MLDTGFSMLDAGVGAQIRIGSWLVEGWFLSLSKDGS